MELLKNIKRIVRNYSLRRLAGKQSRKKKMVSIRKASSVGILFEVLDDTSYQHVHQYIQKLQDMRIKVKVLGYIREKHLSARILPVLSFDLVYEKDLNWFGKPKTVKAGVFWSTPYDICINIASSECFPLKYAACKSDALLKVGPFSEQDKEYYDIMITPEVNHNQNKFLDEVHEYLSILNPKENA